MIHSLKIIADSDGKPAGHLHGRRPNVAERKRAHIRALRREQFRRWRLRHPVRTAWHIHKWNARQRRIAVLWTLEEFTQFCHETGYHIIRADGWEIDRKRSCEGYSLDNCQLLSKSENGSKGSWERGQWRSAEDRRADTVRLYSPALLSGRTSSPSRGLSKTQQEKTP